MEFEWGEDKRIANLEKHGIDFAAAALIWNGTVLDPYEKAWIKGEHRRLAVGALTSEEGEKIVAIVYTLREGCIRIISARAARRYEREEYWRTFGESGAGGSDRLGASDQTDRR